jgi:hypothetical protein
MDVPLGLLMCFSEVRERDELAPLSRVELARVEQAYYERFLTPPRKGALWKTVTAFIAPPIAAVTAAIGLLVYSMH